MPHPIIYSWPAPSTTAIALAQTLSGAGTMLLNGSLSLPVYKGQYIPLPNQQRVITLTSTANNSGTNVTITGTLQGAVVSSTIAGSDNNTVATTQLFDSVTKITTNGAITSMSVGTGTTGQLNFWTWDYYLPAAYGSLSVAVTGTINYTYQVTNDNVQTVASPTFFTPITALTTATTSEYAPLTGYTCAYANILINSSSAGGSLIATFIQQGAKA